MLTVYIDFKAPAAYLALKPTLALAAKYDLELDWRPFRTVERDVPKTAGNETVGESHRRVRAVSQRSTQIKYAKLQGIDLIFPKAPSETNLALAALTILPSHHTEFVTAAFAAYWQDHADLSDEETVMTLIHKSAGIIDLPPPASWQDTLDASLSAAEEAGIVGAPAYVINSQIFVGREHLPWIEEIISASDPSG